VGKRLRRPRRDAAHASTFAHLREPPLVTRLNGPKSPVRADRFCCVTPPAAKLPVIRVRSAAWGRAARGRQGPGISSLNAQNLLDRVAV
jgi:hypothetical protein